MISSAVIVSISFDLKPSGLSKRFSEAISIQLTSVLKPSSLYAGKSFINGIILYLMHSDITLVSISFDRLNKKRDLVRIVFKISELIDGSITTTLAFKKSPLKVFSRSNNITGFRLSDGTKLIQRSKNFFRLSK